MQASHFDRSLLPPARTFYESELGPLGRPNRAGWSSGPCPFHKSKSGKSFAVHVDGAFVCRGCGVKGRDLVAFVQQRDRCDFKTAGERLGAWTKDGVQVSPALREDVLVQYLTCDFVIDGVEYHASAKDEPRDYANKIRRFYREASDRLIELSQGDSERHAGERDECWERMACALPELRGLGIS
jgi:hypothetical protein